MNFTIKGMTTAAALALLCAVPAIAQDSLLTLDRCIAIALSDNPTIKIADREIDRVDYSRKDIIGQLLPSIEFGANYNRMLAKQVMYMNMDGFGDFGGMGSGSAGEEGGENPASRASGGKSDGGIKVGLDNSYSMGFTAAMPVIAPQLWKSLSLSDSQILLSVEQARSSKLEMVNQVKSAYYMLMLAEDSRRVIQESYDMAALTHEIYKKKYAAGAASDYDVLRTSVAVKNVEPELLQAEVAIKQARLQLLILMGLDSSFDLQIAGRLADYEASMYEATLGIDRNYSNNPQLRINDVQSRILAQTVKVQKMAWSPTLALSANYNWTSMSNGSPFRNFKWNPYSSVGLSLSIPIFQGGKRWNSIRQAEIQAEEMVWQRENLERSVAMQVDLAVDNIGINVRQISSCSESVVQADRAHSIMEKSFEIGAASYLDLRDSELALTRARLAYFQAIYNYLIANSELELLLGNADIDKYANK